MKKRILSIVPSVAYFLFSVGARAADEAGYETVALSDRETISGKMLVVVAYAVIFGFLALYAWSIVLREQKVRKSLDALRRSIGARK